MRWAELPWGQLSAFTVPLDMHCKQAYPTRAPPFRPASTSPTSRMFRCCVECPQTPAKQSACSSEPNRKLVGLLRVLLPCRLHLALDAEQFLHMMSNFMGQDVGLGKLSGRAEALLQFVVEAQIDINLLILWTVERTGRGLRQAAGRIDRVAKQHEFGVVILRPLRR